MARHDRWWEQGTAVVLVVVVHAAIGWWLEHARPDGWPSDGRDDAALQIDYITRPRAIAGPRARARPGIAHAFGRLRRDAADRTTRAHAGSVRMAATTADAPAAAIPTLRHEALDLRLPPSRTEPSPDRDPFERAPALAPRSTRFERAWVPAGNVFERASARSAVVRGALGLFGGPPRRCTEIERRLLKPDCLPLHGDEDADDVMLKSAAQ